jgi:hypothetical protein
VNLEEFRTLFIVAILGVALVVASPAFVVFLPEVGSERFSEFWLLNSEHVANDFPYNVGVDEVYNVSIGIGNHMGDYEYYLVYVKFGNVTQGFPDIDGGVASSLEPLYEYRLFVDDGDSWESSLTFGFEDVFVQDDVLTVGSVVVNGVSFPVDASALFDAEGGGFFFQLFFELWRYDLVSESFSFDDRFVGLQLNMIAS